VSPRAAGFSALLCLGALGAAGEAAGEASRIAIPRQAGALAMADIPRGGIADDPGDSAITEFRQREPGDGEPCSEPTAAWVTRDDDHLYVRFECSDSSGAVRAHLSRRDDLGTDDRVMVYLDTYGDRRRAYMFACNPLGVQLDAVQTEGQDEDDTFDTVWSSSGELTPSGYRVTMTIPFRSLRFADAREQTWGVALGRVIPRRNEESYWPYITKRVSGLVPQFARTTGLAGISPGRNVQVIPYGISTRSRFLDTEGDEPAIERRNEWRGGLDAKVVLRDTYTLDAAIQPDFSQVESDEPQVTINQRFEVYFPERRPFFIENAGYFATPEELFFSRRIADPGVGVRFTGKAGSWVVGGVAADDRAPGRAAPVGDPGRGARAWNEVVSLRRELGAESSVGLLATSRDFAGGSNRVLSFDGRWKATPTWVLTAQAMRSLTRAPGGAPVSGPGFVAEAAREGRHVENTTSYKDLSPEFRSQLGFVKRVDIRELEEEFKYRWRPKGTRVEKYGPTLSGKYIADHAGRLQEWDASLGFRIEWTGPSELNVEHGRSLERFEGVDFDKQTSSVELSSDALHWFGFDAKAELGTDVNFDPGPGLAPFLGNARAASVTFTLRPSPRASLAQTWIYSGLTERAGAAGPGVTPGASIFDNGLLRSKLTYQFTRPLSLRAIVDYELVSPNPTRVDLESQRRLGVDVLATYLLNPGTAIYVGYADQLENLALDPTLPTGLRRTGAADMSTVRQFFIKASYLIRR